MKANLCLLQNVLGVRVRAKHAVCNSEKTGPVKLEDGYLFGVFLRFHNAHLKSKTYGSDSL